MPGAGQPAAAGAALDDEPELLEPDPLDPELDDPEPDEPEPDESEPLDFFSPEPPDPPDPLDSPEPLPAAARLSVR